MELGPMLPALLDALVTADIGVCAFASTGGKVEKLYINQAMARSMGYTPEEWLSAPLWSAVSEAQRSPLSSFIKRIASSGEPFMSSIELRVIHRDGHEVPMEATGASVAIPGGRVLVAVTRDMSIRRQTQLSLLEADRLALVGALASGFAHETNNPLTSVLLNLRSLRKLVSTHMSDGAQTAALRALDDITTGAERIAGNVRALQTLATRSATQTLDLATVVSSALRLAAPTLEPRANVVRQIFPVSSVVGEESRIGQAVLAMLLFSSSGFDSELAVTNNQIIVSVEEREGMVVVEVSDNGRALNEDEVERAFDPFFRSPVRGAGVGVGLGVARSVAITLGGDVTLAPRKDGGAVITMRLPPAPQPPAP